jgi:hypothetical protein
MIQFGIGLSPRHWETMLTDLADRWGVSEAFIAEAALTDAWAKVQTDPTWKPDIFHRNDNGGLLRGRELLDWLRLKYQHQQARDFFEKP